MNRQQKNRKDRRRVSRLMSLALSASMVLSSSVLAYGSPVMDPNAAMAVQQTVEDIYVEQQAEADVAESAGIRYEKKASFKADDLQYGISASDLKNYISENGTVYGRISNNSVETPLVLDQTYKLVYDDGKGNQETDLSKLGEDAFGGYIPAGTYTIKVVGQGEYQPTEQTTFLATLQVTIKSLKVTNFTVTQKQDKEYIYNGSEQPLEVSKIEIQATHPIKGSITITADDSDKIAKVTDKTSWVYSDNVNAGTSKATIQLNSNFTNENATDVAKKEQTYTIKPLSINNATINYTGSTTFPYNGNVQGPDKNNVEVTLNGQIGRAHV